MTSGPLRFDEFQERALYDSGSGFFARGRGAGRRRGDFITSPEVGPLFGAVLARYLDAWWERLARPSPFAVVDAGAGRGVLAASLVAAAPACLQSARVICVERSPLLAAEARELLAGRAEVVPDLPTELGAGVILANELLDNIPVRVVVADGDGWSEVWVDDGREVLRPTEVAPPVERAPAGTRLPVSERAAAWVRSAIDALEVGVVAAFDYGTRTTAELVGRPWLRTYAGHERGVDPLEAPGHCDITADVAFDQLPPATRIRAQGEFLEDWGVEELVAEGRRVWRARAHLGDLEAIRARSRISEAEALRDPSGLGAFLVAEWEVP